MDGDPMITRSIAKELKAKNAILDGEIVDASGLPAFYNLMKRQCQVVYYAFDILWLKGHDLRDLPLVQRKKLSAKLCHVNRLGLDPSAMWTGVRLKSSS